jgi:hypothetical protein
MQDLHSPQTGSGPHPASYPMGTGGGFTGGRYSGGVKLTTHLQLVPRSRMVELYLHSALCLHGTSLNQLNTATTLPFVIHTLSKFYATCMNLVKIAYKRIPLRHPVCNLIVQMNMCKDAYGSVHAVRCLHLPIREQDVIRCTRCALRGRCTCVLLPCWNGR